MYSSRNLILVLFKNIFWRGFFPTDNAREAGWRLKQKMLCEKRSGEDKGKRLAISGRLSRTP